MELSVYLIEELFNNLMRQIHTRLDLQCFRINILRHTLLPFLSDDSRPICVPRSNLTFKCIWHTNESLRQLVRINRDKFSITNLLSNVESHKHSRHAQKQPPLGDMHSLAYTSSSTKTKMITFDSLWISRAIRCGLSISFVPFRTVFTRIRIT